MDGIARPAAEEGALRVLAVAERQPFEPCVHRIAFLLRSPSADGISIGTPST
jgi:hypothetical protein